MESQDMELDLKIARDIIERFWCKNIDFQRDLANQKKHYRKLLLKTKKAQIMMIFFLIFLFLLIIGCNVIPGLIGVFLKVVIAFGVLSIVFWKQEKKILQNGAREELNETKNKILDLKKKVDFIEKHYQEKYPGLPSVNVFYRHRVKMNGEVNYQILSVDELMQLTRAAYEKGEVNNLKEAMQYCEVKIIVKYLMAIMEQIQERIKSIGKWILARIDRKVKQTSDEMRTQMEFEQYKMRNMEWYLSCFKYESYTDPYTGFIKSRRVPDHAKMEEFDEGYYKYRNLKRKLSAELGREATYDEVLKEEVREKSEDFLNFTEGLKHINF